MDRRFFLKGLSLAAIYALNPSALFADINTVILIRTFMKKIVLNQ